MTPTPTAKRCRTGCSGARRSYGERWRPAASSWLLRIPTPELLEQVSCLCEFGIWEEVGDHEDHVEERSRAHEVESQAESDPENLTRLDTLEIGAGQEVVETRLVNL